MDSASTKHRFAAMIPLLAGAFALAGCAAAKDLDLAADGTQTAEAENDVAALSQVLVGEGASGELQPATALVEGALTPAEIGDRAKAFFAPAGCLAVTNDVAAKKVTYLFNGCTGPKGLAKVTGAVTVTWAVTGTSAMHLDYAATGLQINAGSYDWSAAADVTASGTQRTAKWTGSVKGTTGNGVSVDRSNEKVFTWDTSDACLTIDGTSSGTYGERRLKTTIAGFKKCKGSCPEAGGTLVLEDPDDGRTVTVTFNGTGRATVTGTRNVSTTVTLACGR